MQEVTLGADPRPADGGRDGAGNTRRMSRP